jgi:ferredoxin, 2Fe-2S
MPWISFTKKHKPAIQVIPGANLMKSLLQAEIPVASSCNGDGVCAKCRLEISSGEGNLSAPNETEKFLKEKFQLKPGIRISCQTFVLDDVEIDATYW